MLTYADCLLEQLGGGDVALRATEFLRLCGWDMERAVQVRVQRPLDLIHISPLTKAVDVWEYSMPSH